MAKRSERPAAMVKLVGGRLCLDFVNSVGGRRPGLPSEKGGNDAYVIREEQLNEYRDLLAWSRHTGLLAESEARELARASRQQHEKARLVFKRALILREAIYRICKATISKSPPRRSDLELLNQELAVARVRMNLVAGKGNFVWAWIVGRHALDRMLWRIADSAAELLTTGDLTRVRECRGEDCGWLFLDTSKNRSRQWCDMRDCGNVAKVRRFRTRLRAGT